MGSQLIDGLVVAIQIALVGYLVWGAVLALGCRPEDDEPARQRSDDAGADPERSMLHA